MVRVHMIPSLTALLLLSGPALLAQGPGQDPVSILKGQIDGILNEFAKTPASTPIDAAKFLIAAVRSPRLYDLSDGPFMRKPLEVLRKAQRNSGLFGKGEANDVRVTSAWAYQALSELDAEKFAADLSTLKTAFAKEFGLQGVKLDQALHPYTALRYASMSDSSNVTDAVLTLIAKYELLQQKRAREAKARPWEPFQQKAIDFLLNGPHYDGKWLVPGGPGGAMVPDPGINALCIAAVASKPEKLRTDKEKAAIENGVKFLLAAQGKDGSFSNYLPNYITCTAVMALSRSGIPGTGEALRKAQRYLLSIQNAENNGYLVSDRDYGSIGYGGDRRGDVSNTQMALDALRATGLPAQHEAIEKALVFLRRSQNLPGKGSYKGTRRTEDGRKVPVVAGTDGGSAYYPGNSPFGYDETSEGGQVARSYGSMTYALLKCYILADLPKEDPRLQAALNWCFTNFTLDENPGSKKSANDKARYQGLYYYYLTLARALSLAGVDKIKDRDWRTELRAHLQKQQNVDGSWVNAKNSRWWENNPLVVTAYSLLALSE